jgi:methylmalonyl-CoA mutase N-terminal domain/subunit
MRPQLQTITVQGSPYHNGGASTTQELAFALATAVEYLRAMQARGLSMDDTAPRIPLLLVDRLQLLHGNRPAARRAATVGQDRPGVRR